MFAMQEEMFASLGCVPGCQKAGATQGTLSSLLLSVWLGIILEGDLASFIEKHHKSQVPGLDF